MTEKDNKEWTRSSAVSIHEDGADWFAAQYRQTKQYYMTPFMYGRKQIDIHFNSQIADLTERAKVLDVGCGTGDQLALLLDQGFDVHGIEPAEKMRNYAKAKLSEGTVIDGSVLDMPFDDNLFDFVYALEVFRYLDSRDNMQGLKEIRRVLKPGGTFFGTFVNQYALDGFVLLVALRKMNERISGINLDCHTEFETPGKLKSALHSAHFTDVEIHGAMIASLRIAYKLAPQLGKICARVLEPFDNLLSDTPFLRAFAAHLIGIARK